MPLPTMFTSAFPGFRKERPSAVNSRDAPARFCSLEQHLTGSGTGTGRVTVNAGAVLGGDGSVGGATLIADNGILSPGNSPGLLTFSDTLTLAGSNSKAIFEITSGARGTAYDAVNVTGFLTYNGDLTLTLNASIVDGTYDLFGGAGAGALTQSGNFDSILFAGTAYSGSFTNGAGIWTIDSAGQSFAFTQSTGDLFVTTVPEPAACMLLAIAGMLMVAKRRR